MQIGSDSVALLPDVPEQGLVPSLLASLAIKKQELAAQLAKETEVLQAAHSRGQVTAGA